ncbi:Fc.00g068310.m01.CDS01 [Cosmosporella sp. VM-42]
MADKPNEKPEVAAPVADAQEAPAGENKTSGAEPAVAEDKAKTGEDASKDNAKVAAAETKDTENSDKPAETSTEKPKEGDKKPAADEGDVEMKDATEAPAAEEAAAESSAPPADGEPAPAEVAVKTPTAKGKPRRKSVATASKSKALNRKSSKARLTNLDAKPGDHFLVKLKGFPAWPAIICDESMLPQALVDSRPMTAARPDGTYHEPYADGGKRANDRSFPVMYLFTNEFGWVANTNLTELSPEKAEETITEKMRKDLREAFLLAAENNPVEHYRDMLKKFQEDQIAQEEAKRAAVATPKKSKKGKTKAVEDDLEMADADDSLLPEKPKSSKKRKAEEDVSTPARTDSVKKPKIKLNTSSTPKVAANGTPKAKDESAVKSKPKAKKAKDSAEKKAEAPKEPKMTPEERLTRKEKEVLYLRHKLQRGLLTRDQQPQEAEMKQMSDYITMLENFKDLEVSIIRNTKINKVLKAILKLELIPREDEFKFKSRSQALLDKWNSLMAGEGAPSATNGVNGSKAKSEEKDAMDSETKGTSEEPKKAEPEKPAEDSSEDKDAEAKSDAPAADQKEEKPASEEAIVPSEPVEAAA